MSTIYDDVHELNIRLQKLIFIEKQKKLLGNLQKAVGKEEKMRIALESYKHINENFAPLLNTLKPEFISFAATVYNKTTEFYRQLIEGIYDDIDKELVDIFTKEFMNTRTFLIFNLINLKKTNPLLINMNDQHIREAYNNIEGNKEKNNNIEIEIKNNIEEIKNKVKENFGLLLNNVKPEFISFAATAYNKTTEFYNQLKKGIYDEIDKEIVDSFTKEFMIIRTFLRSNLITLKKTNPLLIDMNEQHIREAYNNIEGKEKNEEKNEEKNNIKNNINQRPRRNIPRVNYAGM